MSSSAVALTPGRLRLRTLALVLVGVAAMAPKPAAAEPTPAAAWKIAPALLRASTEAPEDTVAAWVEFADKGELGPGDLARRLEAARLALSPRALARRLRAHVRPLVDYLDLPIEPSYLQALEARGLRPYGASRWFNRVAVRAPASRVAGLADLSFVRSLARVERVRRSPDPQGAVAAPARADRAARVGAVSYGYTQGAINQLHLAPVHDLGFNGAGMLVCVLDEGFNCFDTHEALRDQVIPAERQRDFYRGLTTVQDPADPGMVHGTWVLGLLAARKFGTYVGAAYGADFALGRTEVRGFERQVELVYWGMGAEWADSLGADVISSSPRYTTLDSPDTSYTYADMDGHTTIVTRAAEIAASKGILVVSAIGNDGDAPWHYLSAPSDANGDSVLAAGAVDLNGNVASFSSYGPSYDGRVKPDLVAQGVQDRSEERRVGEEGS